MLITDCTFLTGMTKVYLLGDSTWHWST